MGKLFKSTIGKWVIVRSRNEGLNFGKLVMADETGCALKKARRLWHSAPKDKSQSWYEGVANSGVSDDSKLSPAVKKKVIVEDYSITVCTDDAAKQIRKVKAHESS